MAIDCAATIHCSRRRGLLTSCSPSCSVFPHGLYMAGCTHQQLDPVLKAPLFEQGRRWFPILGAFSGSESGTSPFSKNTSEKTSAEKGVKTRLYSQCVVIAWFTNHFTSNGDISHEFPCIFIPIYLSVFQQGKQQLGSMTSFGEPRRAKLPLCTLRHLNPSN